jgi:multidrug efflux pump subunit AcrA (membrane-fusion protein)
MSVSLVLLLSLLGQSPAPGHTALITVIDKVEVPAREVGLLKKVYVREGEVVQPGQLLAELDATEAELAVRKAREELAIAEAQAKHELKVQVAELTRDVAQAELARSEKSNEKFADAVSKTEMDRLRLTRDKAALEIDQAKYELLLASLQVKLKSTELSAAEQLLERRRIFAPVGGQIVAVDHEAGEWMTPGEKLFQLVNTDRVRAECLLNVQDFPDDLTGVGIEAKLLSGGKTDKLHTGTIKFVDPEINSVNGQFRIWAEIANTDRLLRPGHRVQLTILKKPAEAPPAAAMK